jgi:hypothetical protein
MQPCIRTYYSRFQTITNLKQQIQCNTTHQKSDRKENINNMKLATFTYYSPKVRKITNIFKQTDIKIAFKNNNTVSQILDQRPPTALQSTTKVESTN